MCFLRYMEQHPNMCIGFQKKLKAWNKGLIFADFPFLSMKQGEWSD